MRKLILTLSRKLRWRLLQFHTWLLSSSFASVGRNVRIEYPIRMEQPQQISIGSDCVFYSRSWINPVVGWSGRKYEGKITFGDRVMVSYSTQISAASSITIEDDVVVAAGVIIMDHIHDYRYVDSSVFSSPLSEPLPVRICKRAFLGAHCFIGPGVTIGEQAVISANAVVTKDVPAYCVAVGSPARITRYHDPSAATQSDSVVPEG